MSEEIDAGGMWRGAVATANPDAARAAARILEAGGNAVDAAVAAAFAMGVVEPLDNGLGGSGFALVHCAHERRTVALDFLGTAPRSARFELQPAFTDFMTGYHIKVAERANELGHRAVAVPGAVRGLAKLLQAYGSLPFAEVIAPAVDLAERGFRVDRYLAERLSSTREYLARFPEAGRIFLDAEGAPWSAGTTLRLPDLARSLRRLQAAGPEDLYTGELARALIAEMERGGGFMTAADLADYRPVVRTPVTGRWRGLEVATMPPPSTGGYVLAGLSRLAAGRPDDLYQALAEAMREMFALRAASLGDPAFEPVDLAPLGIDSATLRLHDPSLREPPQTTALATLDRAGNAVSITYSNMNHSGVVVPGTGIVLNNQLLLFNPWPGTPNSLAGGKRPVSSMMPTLVLREGRPVVALGASGSTRIPTSLMQVLYHLCVRGLPVDQAVAVPRLHAEGELITADAELEAVAGRVANRLGVGLELLPGRDSKLGVVQCISRLDAERPTAVGDPRAQGAGLVV